jgi:hypothetical protein
VSDDVQGQNEELLRAYRLCFGSAAGQAVLADLAPFCRAADTCFHQDPRIHAALEGRREVWLRIQQFMHLQDEDLQQLALRRPRLKPATEEETDE